MESTTTLNIRGIEVATVTALKRSAQARGWTLARYIKALVELHEGLRAAAEHEGPEAPIGAHLEAYHLLTVRS